MVVGYISFLYISDCSESILYTRGRHSRDHMVVGYISFLYISDCSESILDTRGHHSRDLDSVQSEMYRKLMYPTTI
jgi:hypothetical protein